jgi:hypothetical protein
MPRGARIESHLPFRVMAPDPEELRRAQADRERSERRRQDEAADDEEEHEAERRAEKAAYLKDKLREQAEEDQKAD